MKQVFMNKVSAVLLIALGLIFTGSRSFPAANQARDYSFHPVLIYSFVRYIEWPTNEDRQDFDIGLFTSDNTVVSNFQKMARSKSTTQQRFTIHQFTSLDQMPKDLELIFITENYSSSLSDVIRLYKDGTLIITEKENALQNGSCINFVTRRGRPYFELNTDVISGRSMKVNQRLIDLSINN
ncbi:MAG TPA: hypothetical protein DCE41_29885 [Cytophagales bacterium]|nr:hypothetical protein [Cytophagales bacterium]HAA23533.1 hypothetical protein [Cytophagales bacterium]HAP59353.1 hypothetical protein [Cytophagales bacterium]